MDHSQNQSQPTVMCTKFRAWDKDLQTSVGPAKQASYGYGNRTIRDCVSPKILEVIKMASNRQTTGRNPDQVVEGEVEAFVLTDVLTRLV